MTQFDDIKGDLTDIKVSIGQLTKSMEDRDRRLAALEHTVWDNGQPGHQTRIGNVEHSTLSNQRDITTINRRCESRACAPKWWQRWLEKVTANIASAIVIAIIFALFALWASAHVAAEVVKLSK